MLRPCRSLFVALAAVPILLIAVAGTAFSSSAADGRESNPLPHQALPTGTPPPPTATPTLPVAGWNPPSLAVPLARHPYDHYWLIRPVASNYVNYGLSWYAYGSDGPANDLRIHHGIDIPNPVGVEVKAAGDGTVVVASHGFVNELETIGAYGNVIAIEHDFGYRGQAIYTLYAHLSTILAEVGDHVQTGEVIGLIGATGLVSGPHVHFEVRLGRNGYYYVRNPDLWVAPYAGTGVIAGRLLFPDGTAVRDADVAVIDPLSGQTVYTTTSYAGFGVNADDNWKENFVIPDVPVGRYVVTATYGTSAWFGEVTVREGMTNWVEMLQPEAGS